MLREPLTKSAPSTSAATNRPISSGRCEPSESSVTMMSPVAASTPHSIASPLPRRFCEMMRASGRQARAASIVPSVEPPSTSTISYSPGIRGSTSGMFSASLSAGTTMLTRGASGRSSMFALAPPGVAILTVACSMA